MKIIKLLIVISVFTNCILAQTTQTIFNNYEFNLGIRKLNSTNFFHMDTEVLTFGVNSKLQDSVHLSLFITAELNDDHIEKYICKKFEIKLFDGKTITIPKLENWSYSFQPGIDKNNQVFGIEHSYFENLLDSEGNTISPGYSYFIYNSFIDFHGLNNVFSEPADEGTGIEELKTIGQKIIHEAANTNAPTNLGSNIKEGSYFQNGEITLELLGLSNINDSDCGIVKYDSGESSFKMIMNPAPEFEMTTLGRSHYFGEIYKNLTSGWIEKANLTEIVITETTLPAPPNKINSVIERHISLLNITNR